MLLRNKKEIKKKKMEHGPQSISEVHRTLEPLSFQCS